MRSQPIVTSSAATPQAWLPSGPSVVGGNSIELLVDGEQTFPAMLAAIAAARAMIALESYIYATDPTGARFRDALVAARVRGVAVFLLIDGVGSLGTDAHFFKPLLDAGGELTVFRPPRLGAPWGVFGRRDHRKILVVDGFTAFIGGMNIADDYAPLAWGGGAWHDCHARLEGPAARELLRLFAATWRRQSKRPFALPDGVAPPAGEVGIQILESRLRHRHTIRRAYLDAIRRARISVRICNAYCIPDRGILRALRNARRRGVQVQLLLAGTTDVRAVQWASHALYQKLLAWGVEIFEWTDRVLHAKSAVMDGVWCSLGSYNMDRRSLLHNLEANIACQDAALGGALDAQFARDVSLSKRIDLTTWHRRSAWEKVVEQLCYKLRYLL